MLMTNGHQPDQCSICGFYLTSTETYGGNRCLDPGHWQAAGILAPTDFYQMAQIAARAQGKINQRFDHQRKSS
jgi:hypothetical protein